MKFDIKKLKNLKLSIPLILFLLIIPAFAFFLKPGIYWNMHDDMQMVRQLELEKCLHDGQIPCRWSPDLGYGYGYPLFNFYPPMPYIVGQIWRTLGFSFVTTIKLTALTQIISSTFAMYLLARVFFGPIGGLVSALFYAYAPYHAVNLYIRGAMNEAWAAVFFPLIFYYCYRLIQNPKLKNVVPLSLAFAGLLLSHNPMALTFTPVLLIWALFWILQKHPSLNTLRSIIGLGLFSAIISLGLTSFYTLPVLGETKYVQIESMFQNYYHYSVHFTSLRQLFISNFWGDGASVWGQEDNMSFMTGYLHWIIPLFLIIFSAFRLLSRKKIDSLMVLAVIVSLMGFFSAFMTHERSAFIWGIFTPVQKIQFPWRFQNLTVFLFSLAAGYLIILVQNLKSKKLGQSIPILIIVLLLILNVGYFHPLKSGPLNDSQKFSGLAWTNQITSGIYDYLPKTARIAPLGPAKEYVDEIRPATAFVDLSGQKKGTDWQYFNLKVNGPAEVILSQLAYPGFKVFDYDQELAYTIEPELGRIVINLSAGSHQIYIKLYNTPLRAISNTLSLIVWMSLIIYLTYPLWKRKPSSK